MQTFHVDLRGAPIFIDFPLDLHFILRGDGLTVPVLMIDLDFDGATRITEGIVIAAYTLFDMPLKGHPAIVTHLFRLRDGGDRLLTADKAALLSSLGLLRRTRAREATRLSENRCTAQGQDSNNRRTFFHCYTPVMEFRKQSRQLPMCALHQTVLNKILIIDSSAQLFQLALTYFTSPITVLYKRFATRLNRAQNPNEDDTMRVLLIEDDRLIGDGIKAGLSKMGFTLDWFSDGNQGLAALDAAPYDAVILDLSLPGIDGLEILRRWREAGHAEPVLILTARDALEQRVTGLQQGADDYLCKPFALIEVAARLQALIRRNHGQTQTQLSHGAVTLDPLSLTATLDGAPLLLKPKEFALLELLLRNAGRVLPRSLIEEKLYNWEGDVSSNAVEVHIHHLRRKLGSAFIRTVHGVGYTLGDA